MEQMRLDFDAAEKTAPIIPKNQAEDKKAASEEPKILTVSEVNRAVKITLESNYRLMWIQGEISNFRPQASNGHFYFTLKDSKAQISAVMFRGHNQSLKFKPHDGLEVIVRGRITVYEPRGNYQIFCEQMEPVGAGALQMAFEQLKRKLELEGLFKLERKRPIPKMPRHVAVVTSPTGAAIRDILNILGRRFAGLRVTVVPAVVQGDSAPASICAALALAQKLNDVDVMIVGRGGGSIEDMWCFNDERVARAISACRVPIISAVGHEIDFTIADFVADLRAPTPSAAAELVCKNAAEINETITVLKKRLYRSWLHHMQIARQRTLHAAKRLVDPKRRLQDLAMRCDELTLRMESAIQRYFQTRSQQLKLALSRMPSPRELVKRLTQDIGMLKNRLDSSWLRTLAGKRAEFAQLAAVLDSLSPLKVVERGYSITYKNGRPVKDTAHLKKNDKLEITFAKGQITAKVDEILE